MRVQLNYGMFDCFTDKTVIASGDCVGDSTYEVECELPEFFDDNMTNYEATIENNQVVELTKKPE